MQCFNMKNVLETKSRKWIGEAIHLQLQGTALPIRDLLWSPYPVGTCTPLHSRTEIVIAASDGQRMIHDPFGHCQIEDASFGAGQPPQPYEDRVRAHL